MFVREERVIPVGRELMVVRHGETEWSSSSRYASHTDIELSEDGRRQAVALGGWIRDQGLIPDRVLCSPLRRSVDTAAIIWQTLRDAGIDVPKAVEDPRLVEMDFGSFEGQTARELEADPEFQAWRTTTGVPLVPEGVESFSSAASRFETAVTGDRETAPGAPSRTLVVAHGHVIRAWCSQLVLGVPNPNSLQIDTGSVSFVRLRGEGRRLMFWNLLPYLQEVDEED